MNFYLYIWQQFRAERNSSPPAASRRSCARANRVDIFLTSKSLKNMITNMNRFLLLILVILLGCSKEKNKPAADETFQKLQGRMWKLDSIVFIYDNGQREVSIPGTMNSEYVKFISTQTQYYYSFNLEPPIFLESDSTVYKQPNIMEVWAPGRTSGPPSYKIEVDSVNDTRLRYNFLNTPNYTKIREYYYHAY